MTSSKGCSCAGDSSFSHFSSPQLPRRSPSVSTKDVRLSLVAYSTPREAYNQLIPDFQKTQAGNGVSFSQSYAASGDHARAVKAGLAADIVALSLAPDVDELAAANLVDAKWKRQSYRGMVTNSLVVFVVRDGNPKKIRGWNDLIRPGVQVVTPNPLHLRRPRWSRYGRLRCAAQARQDRQAGAGLPADAVQECRLAGQRALATRCRHSTPAAATSCSRTRTRPSSPGRATRVSRS